MAAAALQSKTLEGSPSAIVALWQEEGTAADLHHWQPSPSMSEPERQESSPLNVSQSPALTTERVVVARPAKNMREKRVMAVLCCEF